MAGLQLSAAWAARGSPVCLSGITISSRGSSCHRLSRLQQISPVETDFSSTESIFVNSRLCESEDQSTVSVRSQGEEIMQNRPRLALTLEMVEHEHRREAIRKQRSSRRITSNNCADYTNYFPNQNSIRLQDVMQTVIEDPSLELDCSYTCAKAA